MSDESRQARRKIALTAFLLSFLISGIPFWRASYAELSVPNSFFGIGTAAVLLCAALLCFRFQFSLRRSILLSASVFPAVYAVRVMIDTFSDPSHHNLWPLALMIAMVTGAIVATAGALPAWLLARLLR